MAALAKQVQRVWRAVVVAAGRRRRSFFARLAALALVALTCFLAAPQWTQHSPFALSSVDSDPAWAPTAATHAAADRRAAAFGLDVYLLVTSVKSVADPHSRVLTFPLDNVVRLVDLVLAERPHAPTHRLTLLADAQLPAPDLAVLKSLARDRPPLAFLAIPRPSASSNIFLAVPPPTAHTTTLFLSPDAAPDLRPGFLAWVAARMRAVHADVAVAGVAPLAPTDKDEVALGFSPRAWAPCPPAWDAFAEAWRAAHEDPELRDYEPWERAADNRYTAPQTRRNRAAKVCADIAAEFVRAKDQRFVPGLPEGNKDAGLSPQARTQCAGRTDTAEQRETWAAFYARFVRDYRLTMEFRSTGDNDHPKKGPVAETKFYAAHRQQVDAIVSAGRRSGGAVSLTLANAGFLGFAYSFYCNLALGDFWPPGALVWVTNDPIARDALAPLPRGTVVFFETLDGAAGNATHYKMAGYWAFMLSRTLLVREVLRRGVSVFLFDLDQVWLSSPWEFMARHAKVALPPGPASRWDLVGTRGYSKSKTGGEVQGNFLYLRPTVGTRALWEEVSERFQRAYDACCAHVSADTVVGGIEQDQYLLSYLLAFSRWRKVHPIHFVELDRHRFVDGVWYSERHRFHSPPVAIQNNWIVGTANKTARAKKWRHWFYDAPSGTCNRDDAIRVLKLDHGRRIALRDMANLTLPVPDPMKARLRSSG